MSCPTIQKDISLKDLKVCLSIYGINYSDLRKENKDYFIELLVRERNNFDVKKKELKKNPKYEKILNDLAEITSIESLKSLETNELDSKNEKYSNIYKKAYRIDTDFAVVMRVYLMLMSFELKARREIKTTGKREYYQDGRMVPMVGDDVFITGGGFGGSIAYVYGKVYAGTGNVLRVKLTEASSLFGSQGKEGTIKLTSRWTVLKDPELKRRETEHEAKEAEKKAKEKKLDDMKKEANEKLGKHLGSWKEVKKGDIIGEYTIYGRYGDKPELVLVKYQITKFEQDLYGGTKEMIPLGRQIAPEMEKSDRTLGKPSSWVKLV